MIKSAVQSIFHLKLFNIIAGLFAFYLLFGYFAVNPLAKRIVPWIGEKKLASHLRVDQVQFDPFGLVLTVDNLRLSRMDGTPLAGFKRLYVNVETSGLLHFAWRLKDIRLTAPQAYVDIAPNGKLNWAELIARLNENKEKDSGMPRLMIDHVLIEGGDIEYTERNRTTPFKAVLEPLGLELEKISTLPEDRGNYLIAATLPEQGGTIKWKGDLALNPVASNGVVQVQGVKLAKLLQVVNPKSLPIQLTAGELHTSFSYKFAMTKAEPAPYPQASLSNIAIGLNNVAGSLNAQSKLSLNTADLRLPQLAFSLQKGAQVSFNGLSLVAKQLTLTQGNTDLFKLAQADVKGLDFNLAASQLKVADITLQAGELNTSRATDGSINWQQLAPTSQAETKPEATHPTANSDSTKPINFDIANIQLQHWQAAYTDSSFVQPLHAEIKDIGLDFSVNNADGGIAIHKLDTELESLSLQSALYPQALATLNKISLQNGEISLKDSTVKLPALLFSGLQTQLLRVIGKPLNWQAALEPLNKSAGTAAHKTFTDKGQPTPWKVDIAKIALNNSGVHIEDKSTPKPVVLDIQNAGFELQNATLDFAKAMLLKAKLQVKQGGQFDVNGKLALAPFKADLQLKLNALSLKPFSSYVSQFALLQLDDGKASLFGKLYLVNAQKFNSQFSGGFSVNDLAITEEDSHTPFLGWQEVSSDSLKLDIGNNKLHMDELHIAQLVGKLIIFEDKSINVKRMLRAPANDVEPAPATSPADNSTADAFPISVDRVSIENSSLEFADLSLTPKFGTHINTLAGVINGLSSDPNSTAAVELDGKVDDYGSAKVRGSVQPFHATDFTDLKVAFHNLEMNRLTPYSGKFAGRKIDSGKLSVDLEYKIKARQLAGENKFVINKLKLGERVDSKDAANLPLDLAIALLEDSDGVIDLDLPISGSLDDPQFSYGKIVWKAIVNVLGKIVTAPFHALGKLFGDGADKLEAIAFEPGKATIAPEEQEKLKAIATAFSKRPNLALSLSPTYDEAADKVALQEQITRRDVLAEMDVKLKEGEQLGPIDLNNVKAQSAIESLLKERQGQGRSIKALRNLKDAFKTEKPEDVPRYVAMLEQLKLTTNITDAALIALAKARATALQGFLQENAQLDASRISIGDLSKVTNSTKTVNLKMNLVVNK